MNKVSEVEKGAWVKRTLQQTTALPFAWHRNSFGRVAKTVLSDDPPYVVVEFYCVYCMPYRNDPGYESVSWLEGEFIVISEEEAQELISQHDSKCKGGGPKATPWT